jgi:hypothetical protein
MIRRFRTWVAPYLAALVFLVPIGACAQLSSWGADDVGLDYSDETGLPGFSCGYSSESCELFEGD